MFIIIIQRELPEIVLGFQWFKGTKRARSNKFILKWGAQSIN